MARLDVIALVYPRKHKYPKILESVNRWYDGTAVGLYGCLNLVHLVRTASGGNTAYPKATSRLGWRGS